MTIPSAPMGDRKSALIARVIGIITRPNAEWLVIDLEPATVRSLYIDYILILAAIPPICQCIHDVLFGTNLILVVYHPTLFSALSTAIVTYVFSLVGIYVLAFIIAALAPTFQGRKDIVQALKLAAYASTAQWVCGIFHLIPGLGLLSILGLYSFYLFYTGLPVLMKSPPDKSLPYTLVVIVAAAIVFIVIGAVVGAVSGVSGTTAAALRETQNDSAGTLTIPGGGTLDLGRLQDAAKRMEDTAKRAESGSNPVAVTQDKLKALLPAALPDGLSRHNVSTGGAQVAGFGGSTAEAIYGDDSKKITLDVTDMGAAGALTALGSALGASGSQETETGYSKVSQVDGHTVAEEYDRSDKRGSYSVVVADRFLVKAEGSPVAMKDLKGAVKSVDLDQLAALAK